MSKKIKITISAICLIAFLVPLLAGNELSIVAGEPNTENFPEICFGISVRDTLGNKVEGLDTSMVKLYEDSVRVSDLTFKTLAESENHIAILIAVDASFSMAGGPIDSIKSAIKTFVDQLSANDRVGIITFHDDVDIISPFTTSKDSLKKQVDSIKATGQRTELHYGVIRGLELLDNVTVKNKALIVLSDGKNEGEAWSDDDAIEKAREYSIPIFSIGYHTIAAKKYLRVLERMADKTGGQYNDAPTTREIGNVYDEVLKQIQAQQSICYESNVSRADSLEHTININIVTESGEGNKSIIFLSPKDGRGDQKLNWLVIGLIVFLLAIVLVYMNKKNKQKAEQEKQKILEEKEQLEKELKHEREEKAKDKKPRKVQKEVKDKEPDPRQTIISGRTKGQATQVQLYFENGPMAGQTVLLAHEMTIGRSDTNTVAIADQTVSGQHAKIEYHGKDYMLIDLGSTNGTLVNGNKVSQSAIKQGDMVQIGKVKITVK